MILTLISIKVLDDTEIGQDEWEIKTSARVPGGALKPVRVDADVGDGDVLVNEVLGSKSYPMSIFPLKHLGGLVSVRELDARVDEKGVERFGQFLELSCPGSLETGTFSPIVVGRGLDPFITLEDFSIVVRYRWDAVEE